MHSSRVRTACHLFEFCVCLGGVCWGVSVQEGRGVSATAPHMDRQTPLKILPCPKLHFRAVTKKILGYTLGNCDATISTLVMCSLRSG